MKRLAVLSVVLSLTASRAFAAGEILATYETLANSGGIAVFDADTLRVIKLFPTSSPVTAVAYHAINGTIEDIEGTAFVDRNAATGAIIPPGQTNADQYSNRDLASYQNTSFRLYTNGGTVDAQHPLTLIEREEPNNTITNSAEPISNITAGEPHSYGTRQCQLQRRIQLRRRQECQLGIWNNHGRQNRMEYHEIDKGFPQSTDVRDTPG
jgi:hypothetical protein